MKATEWLERGYRANDPIDAMSNYWRGFNNLFFSSPGRFERDKINAFLAANLSEKDASEILEKYSSDLVYLVSLPVNDMRNNGRDTSEYAQEFLSSASSLLKLQAIFMIIYQVRCNLEHGQKSPNRDRDHQLCQCAAPLVAEVVRRSS